MKVLILSQYYPPEGLHIPATVARGLADRGHDVRVVTGYPNYPEGRIYDGYSQKLRSHESDGGVEVMRVPLWIDHSQSAFKRILNYTTFALSAATTRSFARGADVIYVYATQMTPSLGPWLWRMTGGAPYVLHVQDLWPDSITGSSLVRKGFAAKVIESLLNPWLVSLYRRSAAVIGIAPTMVKTLVERGSASDRTHLVYNWAVESAAEEPKGLLKGADPGRGTTRVIYGGNVGDMQDLVTAVEAVHAARDSGVHLTIVGDGVALPQVRAAAERLGATNIEFQGRVPREQMADLYERSDYALVTLRDLPVFRGTIPSKLQASLAHALPVITTVQGDVRTFVEDQELGFTADAESVTSLESALRQAARTGADDQKGMARRAWGAYVSRFSRESGVTAVEGILQSVVASKDTEGMMDAGA
ncbi:glycosyltransferase family 4 protein [Tessaracoccus rhinocerotis]|uniref:Glycosyltransferase family 4 protein n=1 Tax=Tessaracoccus rhinocerotis TaxID=1689449 RepID=A0A553K0Y0_9ACTN|nr:glycosyltransferase family 4 protein [Tessaracoccus rhinocerotis]TRY18362.1 glycosyltransferase family 4 protein [Tessaracoccus rhinocerotis]